MAAFILRLWGPLAAMVYVWRRSTSGDGLCDLEMFLIFGLCDVLFGPFGTISLRFWPFFIQPIYILIYFTVMLYVLFLVFCFVWISIFVIAFSGNFLLSIFLRRLKINHMMK
jgi:hypothetical protein